MLWAFEKESLNKDLYGQQSLEEKKLILQSNSERNNLLYNFLIVLYPKNGKDDYTLFHSKNWIITASFIFKPKHKGWLDETYTGLAVTISARLISSTFADLFIFQMNIITHPFSWEYSYGYHALCASSPAAACL